MQPPTRLDRLSALLQGLAPRVEVIRPQPGVDARVFTADVPHNMLHLHLVAKGMVNLYLAAGEVTTIQGPAIAICRADTPHTLRSASPAGFETLVCARTFLEGPVAPLLLGEFLQPLVVPLADADASLTHVIQLVCAEVAEARCGQSTLLDRAGDILFIGLLRHLVAHPSTQSGLFNGLADPRIASTLVAMHSAPQDNWNLDTLAHRAGMSRTSFAIRFREAMNKPPGKYLASLRLQLAKRAVDSGLGLKTAAKVSGYGNVSALSRALSRARADANQS